MKKLTLTLETVTPMFMAGANPRGAPELRPPAFRGALRYWLRAALGGVIGDQNTQRLYELESDVFGSAADEAGSASAVNVRLAWENAPKSEKFQKQPPEQVTRNGAWMRQPTGRDYLYWSMSESRKNANDWKQFFSPGSNFDLILQTRRTGAQFDQAFKHATVALWLLVHLGGVGSRSRRTAGGLSALETISSDGLDFSIKAATTKEAAQFLGSGLSRCRDLMKPLDIGAVTAIAAYDVLHPSTCNVWVLGIWRTWDSAVTAIGRAMRDFRSYREPDHKEVAKWLNGQAITTVERSAFGLPLPFRYSDGGPSGVVQGHLDKPALERRASPLWLKVTKTTNGNFIGIATLFNSQFLPAGERLHAKGGIPSIPPPPNYKIINDWIGTFADAQKVSYV